MNRVNWARSMTSGVGVQAMGWSARRLMSVIVDLYEFPPKYLSDSRGSRAIARSPTLVRGEKIPGWNDCGVCNCPDAASADRGCRGGMVVSLGAKEHGGKKQPDTGGQFEPGIEFGIPKARCSGIVTGTSTGQISGQRSTAG